MKKKLSPKALTWLLTAVYFTGYLTRINFASIIQAVITDTGFSKSELSLIPVCLFATYAIGQIVNGTIGDHVKPRYMILCGLLSTSVINLVFPFCSGSIALMCVLWSVNGFVQAMLWPSMVQIMVRAMSEDEYNANIPLLTVGSTAAKVALFLLAPILISFASWRTVFYVSAGFSFVATAVFFFYRKRIVMRPLPPPTERGKHRGSGLPRGSVLPILFIFAAIILHGALRDGLDTWMPSYLVEVFHFDDSAAILCRVFLAIFALVAILLSKSLYRRFFKNEVACCVTLFIVSTLSTLVLFLFFNSGAALSIGMMMLISGIQSGINLMLISYVPKRFLPYGHISAITGLLDACSYIGSALSTYGVAIIAEGKGWHFTTGTWLAVSALGLLCVLIAMKPWRLFFEKTPPEETA